MKREETQVPSLPLPFSYNVLLELFRAVEIVASILHNRNERITFLKLRPSVQELMRATSLKERHLAQMLSVFPACYSLSHEKIKSGHETSYQLCLTINLAPTAKISDSLSAGVITERRRIFRKNLTNICHAHHKVSYLVPSLIELTK